MENRRPPVRSTRPLRQRAAAVDERNGSGGRPDAGAWGCADARGGAGPAKGYRRVQERIARVYRCSCPYRSGAATVHYSIPTPEDNDVDGAAIAEVVLSRRVMDR